MRTALVGGRTRLHPTGGIPAGARWRGCSGVRGRDRRGRALKNTLSPCACLPTCLWSASASTAETRGANTSGSSSSRATGLFACTGADTEAYVSSAGGTRKLSNPSMVQTCPEVVCQGLCTPFSPSFRMMEQDGKSMTIPDVVMRQDRPTHHRALRFANTETRCESI